MKISLGFGIGNLRKLSKKGSFPQWFKDSLVCWYDPHKQGLKNSQIVKGQPFLLKDFSNNHLDMTMYGFSGEGMSGMDGYAINTDGIVLNNSIYGKIERNITTAKFIVGKSDILTTVSPIAFSKKLTESNGKFKVFCRECNWTVRTVGNKIVGYITSNPLELDFNTEPTLILYPDRILKTGERIIIEQLPLYEGGLVFDGVDDYGISKGQPILTDYTLISNTEFIKASNFSSIASKRKYPSQYDGAFIYNRGGITSGHNFGNEYKIKDMLLSGIKYMSSVSYNGVSINKGNLLDSEYLLFGGWIATSPLGRDPLNFALYQFLLFNRTLTQEELDYVKYVIMGAELPKPIARWSAKGKTNEDTDKDVLKDLTGNGHDIQLHGFDYSGDSGYGNPLYPDALVFDGVNDYGECNNMPIFTKENGYTVIAKRKILKINQTTACVLTKRADINYIQGAFWFERLNTSWSFGRQNDINNKPDLISFQNSKNYNGISISSGDMKDTNTISIGSGDAKGKNAGANMIFYEAHIFDHDLTPTEIELYIKKYIDKNYKLPIVTPAGEIK